MEWGSKETPKERPSSNNTIDMRPPQPAVTEARPYWFPDRGNARRIAAPPRELRKQNKQKIKELSKKIRNGIINDREANRLHILEKHITRTGGTKKALKNLKDTSSWIPNLNYNSINSIGKITNRKEINRIATSFYRSLYSNQHAIEQGTRTSPEKWNSEPKILPSEVRKAIVSQKSDKAPGPDGITNK
ncbi:hypothetical protein EVAR_18174_1 [Eumeta japonica]|uniref:Uncharacterized protein n=1 Tax=Eumeta variegata TaxID=151549 RepID=A0A4C1UVB5_EUMVA|nr:hypothetical protein EVAR_18174_1 [Eumeta japonica]